MSATIPQQMRALVMTGRGQRPAVQLVSTPQLGDGQLLIRVAAVALNPTDWKHVEFKGTAGLILGIDLAGTVVGMAPGVTGFRVGDRVSAFVHGAYYEGTGAFAEYARADADLVWKVPAATSFEEASTMNCGLLTGVQALFHKTRLELPRVPEGVSREAAPWVLVYSGATSVGLFTIQLARVWGYRVVTTTSLKNFDLVRSLGADAVIDYRDADVVQKIKDATGDTLAYGVDTFAEASSQEACVRAFGPRGGELLVILSPEESAAKLRADVKIKFTLLYSVFGKPFNMLGKFDMPAIPEDRPQMAAWMPIITELVREGKVKSNPVKLWPGGLAAIPDGLEYVKQGKVSAEKIVYRIDQ